MALDVTAWAQTSHKNDIVYAYNLGDYIGKGMIIETFEKGLKNKLFPRVINRTSVNAADGTELSANSNTDTGPTVSTVNPHKIWEYVPYSVVADYGQIVPTSLSRQLGQNLGEGRADRIVSFIAKTAAALGAYTVSDNSGGIHTYTEDSGLSGDNIAEALFDVFAAMDRAKVMKTSRVCVINPKQFYELRTNNYFANADWTTVADNSGMNERFRAFGVDFINFPSIFGTNNASNTDYDTSFRYDASSDVATIWDKNSFALHASEKTSGSIKDIADKEAWLVLAREIWGMNKLQGNGTGSAYVLRTA